jgi:CRP/FNR family transcriptional regulator, cyclic AMP receptor protein
MPASLKNQSAGCGECQRRSSFTFCNLPSPELKAFCTLGMQLSLPKGVIIFREEDPGMMVSVVCSGHVKLSCSSREGKVLIVRIARPGDILGLGAAISGERYEVTAETIEPVTLKSVGKDAFLLFLKNHSQASLHAARALSEEYKSAFTDAKRLALAPTVAGRLASVLLECARSVSEAGKELRFTLALTHEELANLAGTSRETVTRTFTRFQREGLIRRKGSSIILLAPDRLAGLL